MTSLGLDFNNSIQLPITLDGLDIINANALNLNVGLGVLQTDTLGDVYGSDTVTCDIIEPRNNYVNFAVNEPAILGVTMTPYIRNAITGSSSIDFNKGTGVISVTGGFASKWGQNGNTIYNINSTGTVAISNLVVTGSATFNNVISLVSPNGLYNYTMETTNNGQAYIRGGIGVNCETQLFANAGLGVYNYLNSYATLFSNGSSRFQGSLTVTGGSTFNGNIRIISGGLDVTGAVTFNSGLSVSGGIRVTGSSTFNQNITVNGGIGIGQAPIGGAHRLATKGRIRATAFDGNDTSGVLETVSNSGYINYLFTDDNGKAYYSGTTDGLNIQIGLSANNGLQVNGSSVHNNGIYVVGGSEINGSLQIQSGLNVVGGNSTFNNGLTVTFNPLIVGAGMFVTGGTSRFGKDLSVSGTLNVSGGANYANQRIVIGNTGTYTSVGNVILIRTPNSLTEGRNLVFSFGTGTAGTTTQGILFGDATTPLDTGIFGGQQQLYFNAGGSQRMSIGANVNFTTAPYVGGSPIDTDDVAEGTRLYYTDSRARNAISASSPLFYDNTTGVLSLPTNNQTTEWKYSVPTTLGSDRLYFIARMRTDGSGDAGLTIKGVMGGYVQNEVAKVDIAINTRGAVQIYGNLETANATLAGVIALADIAMYSQTIGGSTVYDIYIVGKSGRFFSYDLVVNGSQLGVVLQIPTTTPATPAGTLTLASVLSNLRVYTISGQVNIGTSTNETNVGLKSFKASGGSKIKVESNSASDAEFWARNTVSSYAWYAHNSVNSMRLYNYGTSTDLMTVLNDGDVGIGITTPTQKLSVRGDTTASNKEISIGANYPVNSINERVGALSFYANNTREMARIESCNNLGGVDNNSDLRFSTRLDYNTFQERMRINSAGNVGIGNQNPQYLLSLSANTDTTAHIKSNSTTGYAQLFLQCDNAVAGGGIFLNGSATPVDANMLFVENEIGNIYLLPKQNISYNFGRFQINTNTAYDTNGNAVLQFRDGAGDMGYFYMNNSDNTFISTLPIQMPGAVVDGTSMKGMIKINYNRQPVSNPLPTVGGSVGYNTSAFTISNSVSYLYINISASCYTSSANTLQYASIALYDSTNTQVLAPVRILSFFFNQANVHFAFSGQIVVNLNGAIPAGSGHYWRVQWGGTGNQTDTNDYCNIYTLEVPRP